MINKEGKIVFSDQLPLGPNSRRGRPDQIPLGPKAKVEPFIHQFPPPAPQQPQAPKPPPPFAPPANRLDMIESRLKELDEKVKEMDNLDILVHRALAKPDTWDTGRSQTGWFLGSISSDRSTLTISGGGVWAGEGAYAWPDSGDTSTLAPAYGSALIYMRIAVNSKYNYFTASYKPVLQQCDITSFAGIQQTETVAWPIGIGQTSSGKWTSWKQLYAGPMLCWTHATLGEETPGVLHLPYKVEDHVLVQNFAAMTPYWRATLSINTYQDAGAIASDNVEKNGYAGSLL